MIFLVDGLGFFDWFVGLLFFIFLCGVFLVLYEIVKEIVEWRKRRREKKAGLGGIVNWLTLAGMLATLLALGIKLIELNQAGFILLGLLVFYVVWEFRDEWRKIKTSLKSWVLRRLKRA